MNDFTDSEHLRTTQYRDSSNLDARIALHRRFRTNPEDFHRWYFDRLTIPDRARILELGAGSAAFWASNADRIPPGWEITLTDLSPGMLEDARAALRGVAGNFSYQVADIQAIPFPDGSFDAVMANHMLYHVPDRAKGIDEARRVLRAGGRFYAATNGEGHLREVRQMQRDAGANVPLEGGGAGFGLENGAEQLAASFEHVRCERFPSSLVVTETDPLKAFMRSVRGMYEVSDEQIAAIDRRIDEEMAQAGSIFIHTSVGFFECW